MTLLQQFARLQPTGEARGDHILNPDWAPSSLSGLKRASVLIGVLERGGEWRLLLTQRSAKLRSHAGQIAFPGGRQEAEDRNATATALREAEEEVGLSATALELLGQLDLYSTRTGYLITPILARIDADVAFHAQQSEVAEIFDVSLTAALDPANHLAETQVFEGRNRKFYRIPVSDNTGRTRPIWGVTAGLLVELRRRLDEL